METALAFPEPLPDDPEVVATALETAGIFGVQGDVREAVRWVRRAAELAGDAGIDERAFALARAAADLTSNFSVRAESSAPPPAQGAASAAQSDGATARIASAPPPPPPPPPPVAPQNRPSNGPQESRPPQQAVSVSPIVSLGSRAPQAAAGEDEAEITSQHPPHRARGTDSSPPVQHAQPAPAAPGKDALAALFEEPLSAQPELAVSAAEGKLEEPPTPEPVPVIAPPEQTVRYPASAAEPILARQAPSPNFAGSPRHGQISQHLVPTQVYEPVQPEAAFVEEPVPVLEATVAAAEQAAPGAVTQDSSRQAARASIEQSQEEGVYILRLLKNGEAAAYGTFEALVVLVDPGAELFTGA